MVWGGQIDHVHWVLSSFPGLRQRHDLSPVFDQIQQNKNTSDKYSTAIVVSTRINGNNFMEHALSSPMPYSLINDNNNRTIRTAAECSDTAVIMIRIDNDRLTNQ